MTGQRTTVATNRLPAPGAGFVWDESGSTVVLRPLGADGVAAAFTTRVGGRCPSPFDSLNISVSVGEGPGWRESVLHNRRVAGRAIGAGSDWRMMRQRHGADVAHASQELPDADAIWTEAGHTLAVQGADCPPILVAGPRRIAGIHAGWRGLVSGVVRSGTDAVGGRRAWIGPGIGPCCFEVGPDVADAFRNHAPASVTGPRHVDLWKAAEHALRDAGVSDVASARLCTACHADLFFSHRRDRGRTGRQALIARLA